MNKIVSTILAAGLVAGATTSQADVSANVTLTSDYIWRGITQSANDPALQLALDYATEGGLYVGIWGSNIDWWEPADGGTDNGEDIEIDVYAGYSSKFDFGMAYDIGLIHYIYPGTETTDSDFTELYMGGNFNIAVVNVSMKLSYSDDFAKSGFTAWYLEAGLDISLGDYVVAIGGGRSDGDFYVDGKNEYFDVHVGVSREFAGFGFDLTYFDTDYTGVNADRVGALQNDGQVVFTVSKDFDLF